MTTRMSDQSISQAEIDALIGGLTDDGPSLAAAPAPEGEAALLRSPVGDYVSTGVHALSDLVGTGCSGSLEEIQSCTLAAAASLAPGQALIGRCSFTGGLPGSVYFIVPTPLGLSIITQIYGGVAPSAMDDSALGALSDGLTQFHQTGLTAITQLLGAPVFGGPVEILTSATLSEASGLSGASAVVVARIRLVMGDESGELYMILPQPATAPILQAVRARQARPAATALGSATALGPAPGTWSVAPAAPAPQRQVAAVAAPAPAAAPNPYQTAKFPDLTPRPAPQESRNIDLLLDVSLQVTVELGRTRKLIRDVLSLGPGSVLELDKLAGEQVDVLVNGKLIAKGEVVVIDENYGVRITDIVSPVERVQSLR
jgi:flagellar motor switch protein FliN